MKSIIAILLLIHLIKSVTLTALTRTSNTNVYRFEPIQIVEEPPIGTLILDLASKLEIHDLATSDYKFRFYSPHSLTAHYFLIDQLTGHVKTQRSLDREYLCETKACGPCTSTSNCTLPIEIVAQQSNSFKHQKFVSFDVVIEDKNEFAPKFPRDSLVLNISENAPLNFTVPIDAAYDRDSKQTKISYKMLPHQDEYTDFDVQELYSRVHLSLVNALPQQHSPTSQSQQQLSLTFLKPFDYEQEKEFSFKIIASDSDSTSRDGKKAQPVLSGQCVVTVKVIDLNDNIPVFDKQEYEYRLDEDKATSGTKLIRVHATDKDDGLNGLVKYYFVDQMITLNNPSNGILQQQQQQQQQYSIKSIFSLDELSGWISVSSSWSNLDYEQASVYRLTVRAQDAGVSNSMPVYTTVIIYLNDVNDNPPQISLTVPSTLDDFSSGQQSLVSAPVNQLEISEFTPVEQFLAQIVISDLDSGLNGKLKIEMTQFKKRTNEEKWLQSDDFSLVHLFNNIYSLMSQKSLDREKYDMYSLNITVTDHGQPLSLSTTHKLVIKVKDENDNAPVFVEIDSNSTQVTMYEFNMFESMDTKESWIIIGRVRAIDLDINENALVRYELVGNKSVLSLFRIDSETGLIRAKNYAIDHELTDLYEFKVLASDELNQATANIIIHILDLNDNRPVFEHHTYQFKVKESDPPFTRIGNVKAIDTDKHGSNYSLIKYSILDETSLFRINELTGDLYLQNEIDYENMTSHEFRVIATDGGNLASQPCVVQVEVVDVNDNKPILLTPTDSNMPLIYSVDNLANNQYLFTINATDLDRTNSLYGRIKYIIDDEIQIDYLKNTNEDVVNLFECDPTNGHVRLKLTDYDASDIAGLYALVVKMSDNAGLATNAYIFVLFNNKSQLNDSSYIQKLAHLRSLIADSNLNVNSNENSEAKFRRLVQLLNSPIELNEFQMKNANQTDQLAKFRFQIMQAFNGKNYKYFLAFIIAVCLMISFIVISLLISICYYRKTNKKEDTQDILKKKSGHSGSSSSSSSAASYGVMLTNGSAAASPLSSITSSELIDNSNFLNTSSSTKKVSMHMSKKAANEYDYYYDDEDDEDGFGHLKKMASLKTDSGMSTKSPSQQSSTASLIKINRFKKNKQKSPVKRGPKSKETNKSELAGVEHAELLNKQPNYDSNLNTSGEVEERSLILNTNSPTATTSSGSSSSVIASSITSNTQQLLVLAPSNSHSMFTTTSSVSSNTHRKKMVASSESLASLNSVDNKTNSSVPQDSPRSSTTSHELSTNQQQHQTKLVDVTDCGSPNNFRTFKISYSSPSRQQQQQQHQQLQNPYRTMPVKISTSSLEQKQLNLPVNELFKRYELKKQGANTISSGSMSSSSQVSSQTNQPRKIVEINIKNTSTNKMSPSVLQQKQLDEGNSNNNNNTQVPDYFFKDEKEYKKLLANQNKLNCKHVIETETNKLDNKLI